MGWLLEVARQISALDQHPDPPAIPVPHFRQGGAMTSNDAGVPPQGPPRSQQAAAAAPGPSIAAVAFFFEQCEAQLGRQKQDFDAMDAKAIAVVTAGTLLLAVVPGTQFAARDSVATALTTPTMIVLVLSMVFYILVLAATGKALWIRGFNFPPAPSVLYTTYLQIEPELSKLVIAMDMEAAYERNKVKIGQKQRAMFGGLVLVALEFLALTDGLIVH
jgi:hypothetical protein